MVPTVSLPRRATALALTLAVALPALTLALPPAAHASEEAGADPKPLQEPGDASLEQSINDAFGGVVGAMASVLFFPLATVPVEGGDPVEVPVIVLWLAVGALFFTVRMGFVNLRLFRHAFEVVSGKYDGPDHPGEVTHFQALSAALSATVGLGNIAGVAIAVTVGGPGATFWMIVMGLLGMSSKFVECTLGVKYRVTDAAGNLQGGPMRYLQRGLAEKGLGPLGGGLAMLFAALCVGASFGGGNMFQVGQSYAAVSDAAQSTFGLTIHNSTYGIIMVVAVGLVILGGIQSIASVAEKIVPAMVVIYFGSALWVLGTHVADIPAAFGEIFAGAFSMEAGFGAVLGTMIQGIRRAVFSNEAGIGSASVAHAAAKTDRPVREGVVALLEPFVDTVVVCTLTALVIIITGAATDPANADLVAGKEGAALTGQAFGSVISWFPQVLAVCVLLFAFSTMISWSYYGERCFTFLFGARSSIVYKVLFLGFVYLGAVSSMGNVLDFSDMMILAMSFPNLIGLYIMSGDVKSDLDRYIDDYKNDRFEIQDGGLRPDT